MVLNGVNRDMRLLFLLDCLLELYGAFFFKVNLLLGFLYGVCGVIKGVCDVIEGFCGIIEEGCGVIEGIFFVFKIGAGALGS